MSKAWGLHMPPWVELFSKPQEITFEEDWYDITNESHFWVDWRIRVFNNALDRIGGFRKDRLRVLDVGGGCGILRNQLEKSTNWTVDLAEINRAAIQRCTPGKGRTLLYDITERHDSLIGDYDALILFDILEHIERPEEFLSAALAHLRPGGYVFINVPAHQSLFSAFDTVIGHFRRYNKNQLCRETENLGLKILDMQYWGFMLMPALIARTAISGAVPQDAAERSEIARRGVEPPFPIINSVFKGMMILEISFPFRMPSGTSLMSIMQTQVP